ncbi:MAG: NUDIX hydrolase [Pirellulales bacterium]
MSNPAEPTLLTTSRFRVVQVEQVARDGRSRTREVIRHPGAVVLIPVVDDQHVCLIRNFRVSLQQTLIELPAGTLEPGEPHVQTAARELQEETGYVAEKLELIHTYYPSPGILDECMYLYVATGLTPGDAAREAGEEIDNLVVSWDEALALIDRREIHDSKTLVGLLLYDRWRRSQPSP